MKVLKYKKKFALTFAASLTFLLITSFVYAAVEKDETIDFIYINSSVDESAGGHAALKFKETVFHYQYHSEIGLFLLVKESWPEFQYSYSILQNRTIYIAHIPVTKKTYNDIKLRFLTRYLIQNKRLIQLEQLKTESVFFKNLQLSKGKIKIRGLGFFSKEIKHDSETIELCNSIEKKYGKNFIRNLQSEVEKKLEDIKKELKSEPLSLDKFDFYKPNTFPISYVSKYIELSALNEALNVLLEAYTLSTESIINSNDFYPLSKSELERLQQYRGKVKKSIIGILFSSRYDKGEALLVQIARFQALNKSIELGRLVTLDPFSNKSELVSLCDIQSAKIAITENYESLNSDLPKKNNSNYRTYYDQLKIELKQDVLNCRMQFFLNNKNEEIAFNQIENALGRYNEISEAAKRGERIRVEEGVLLPCKSAEVNFYLKYNNLNLSDFVAVSEVNLNTYDEKLRNLYGYDIVSKNCVTELFETIYSCFSDEKAAAEKLGGYVDYKGIISFIPFCAFNIVKEKFPKAKIEIIPSYRNRLNRIIYEKQGYWALLKESNTVTSTIYYPWDEDSLFLFFTDDAVLTRPLLGVGNTLFAAVNMFGGVLLSPVDDGKYVRRSARGILFSLPELAFFNIRKGTFPAAAFEN